MRRVGSRYAAEQGFSLVELLVSVVILGLLASIALPVVELTRTREKEAELRLALQEIRTAIDSYKDAAANHRIAVEEGASGYPPTLTDLMAGVPDLANPAGPRLYFIRRIRRDPFNSDSTLPPADTWGKRSFSSPPDAPHEGVDVFDVYSTSESSGMNGVPYRDW